MLSNAFTVSFEHVCDAYLPLSCTIMQDICIGCLFQPPACASNCFSWYCVQHSCLIPVCSSKCSLLSLLHIISCLHAGHVFVRNYAGGMHSRDAYCNLQHYRLMVFNFHSWQDCFAFRVLFLCMCSMLSHRLTAGFLHADPVFLS